MGKLKKIINSIKNHYQTEAFKVLAKSIYAILAIFILLFGLILKMGKNLGYSYYFILLNGLLYLLMFVILSITLSIIFYKGIKTEKKMCNKEEYKNLAAYSKKLELYSIEYLKFIHTQTIITKTIEMYLEQRNITALKTYYEKNICPISKKFAQSNIKLKNFDHIKDDGLKGLLLNKFIYAEEKGIEIKIELTEPINRIFIDCIDLYRIIGIFLDNAIEATMETKKQELMITMFYKKTEELYIIIKNTTLPITHNPDDLKNRDISTKGKYRGLGLHIVSEILGRYENVEWKSTYNNPYFTQKIILKEN